MGVSTWQGGAECISYNKHQYVAKWRRRGHGPHDPQLGSCHADVRPLTKGCSQLGSQTSKLYGGELLASRPRCFTPEKRAPDINWIGGWVGPRVGQDAMEEIKILLLPGIEPRRSSP
jgi:hypothetical protein